MKLPIFGAVAVGAAALALAQPPPSAPRQDAQSSAVAEDPALAAVQRVIDRYNTAYQEWLTKMRAATQEERAKIPPVEVDGFVSELATLAEGARGSEAAAKAWMMVVQLAPRGSDKQVIGVAVDAILRDHLESSETASLAGYLGRGLEPADARVHLRRVVEAAPAGAMRASAMLELARSLANDESTTEGSQAEQELEALVARIQAECADRTDSRDRAYPDLAEALVFSRKYLKVGLEAPEIEAADTQGVTFKLSDYRGKVVLLDFWGNW